MRAGSAGPKSQRERTRGGPPVGVCFVPGPRPVPDIGSPAEARLISGLSMLVLSHCGEARVDKSGQLSAVERCDSGLHRVVADLDGRLSLGR